MKYIAAVTLAVLCASPAFAGGGGSKGGGALIGSIFAPITTAVSALNVTALNNVSVLSGNKTNVSALVPVSLKNTNILSGLLGGGSSHGCGCN
jgi:hypothetical protein